MNYNSIAASLDLNMQNKGFVIITNNEDIPRIKKAVNDYCGLSDNTHVLYVYSLEVTHKFSGGESQKTDLFPNTRKFIGFYYRKNILKEKASLFFRSPFHKMDEGELFYSFTKALTDDIINNHIVPHETKISLINNLKVLESK